MGSLCRCIPFFADHGMKYFENSQGNRTLLKIKRAPEPEDIFFENLMASDYDRFKKALQTWIFTIFLIAFGFGLQIACKMWQESLDSIDYTQQTLASLVPAAIIVFVNKVSEVTLKKTAVKESHNTWSDNLSSSARKIGLAISINAVFVVLWVNLKPNFWFT